VSSGKVEAKAEVEAKIERENGGESNCPLLDRGRDNRAVVWLDDFEDGWYCEHS
jgi:hypothetical protein